MKKIVIISASIIVFALIIGQVMLSNHFVTSGLTISQIEEQTAILTEENERLEQEIASASSLLAIEAKAKRLDLDKQQSIIPISAHLPVALDQKR